MISLRRHATTLLLCVLAAAIAVIVFVVDRGATTAETDQRKKSLFPDFRGDVTELRVTAGPTTARVIRGGTNDAGQRGWEVEIGGGRYPAEEQVVDQYVGAIEYAAVERRVPAASVDRSAFRLDHPRLEVAIVVGGHETRLLLGGPAPLPEGSFYAEVVGHGVAVITKQLVSALDVSPEGFRSRRLVPYAPDEVAAITLDGEGGARHLVRARAGSDRGGGFRFEDPAAGGRVAAAALERVWMAVAQMKIEVFLSDGDADRHGVRRVTLSLTPGETGRQRVSYDIGGTCPGHADYVVAIRREPDRASVCVSGLVLDGLTVPASELVDRRLLGARADEITDVKLELAGEGRVVEMARAGGAWHLRAPQDRAVEAEAGNALVDAMLDVQADRFLPAANVDARALGLDPPRATVRVVAVTPSGGLDAGAEERVETLALGAEQGGVVHVRRMEDGAIAVVAKDRAAVLLPNDLALRAKRVYDEPLLAFRMLRVEGRGRVQRLERADDGAFHLVEPKGEGLAADTGLAADLAEALGTLAVERWVPAGANDAAYGLDHPRLIVDAEVGGDTAGAGRRLLHVVLGAPAGSGSFARAGTDPAMFVAPPRLELAADQWLLDRGALRVDPETLARATLVTDTGKKLIIEQAGGVLRVAGAPASAASAAKAAAIRDALGDLTAEAAVAVGAAEARFGLGKPRLVITCERGGGGGGVRIAVGAGDTLRGTGVYYVRRSGVDATYAVAQGSVRVLLEAAEGNDKIE